MELPLLVVSAAVVPLGLALAVYALRKPFTVLLPGYVAAVPFGSSLAAPGPLPASLTSLSSALALLLMAALVLRSGRPAPSTPLTASTALWILLLGTLTATTVWSLRPMVSFAAAVTLAATVLLFLLLSLLRLEAPTIRRVENAAVLGGALATAYGVLQAVTGTLPTKETGAPRFGSDLIGANHTAAALMLPLAIVLWRSVVEGQTASRRKHALLSVWLVVGVLLTQSRGGLLATGAVLVTLIVCAPRRGRLTGTGAVAIGIIALVLVTTPGGIGDRQTNSGSSGRSDIWKVGYAACLEHCVTGSGWNTFSTVYETSQASTEAAAVRRGVSYEPHNNWLLVAVEVGVAGVLLLFAGLVALWRQAVRLPREVRGPPLAALAALVVTGMFLSNLEFRYFWLVLTYVALVNNTAVTKRCLVRPGRTTAMETEERA